MTCAEFRNLYNTNKKRCLGFEVFTKVAKVYRLHGAIPQKMATFKKHCAVHSLLQDVIPYILVVRHKCFRRT
jgi:hypothetical protein